jgi:hypothetical protein
MPSTHIINSANMLYPGCISDEVPRRKDTLTLWDFSTDAQREMGKQRR